MIRATSIVNMNFGRLRRLTGAQITALKQTGAAVQADVEQAQVFPRDTGTLQNESTFVDCSESFRGRITLVSSTPYARRMYYHPEYHFRTEENPNARGMWYEDWLKGGKKQNFARKAFKEIYKRAGGV